MDQLLIALYRLLRGDTWLKYAPKSVQTWGDRVRLRRRIRTRKKLIIEEELRSKYRQGLLYLASKYGKASLGDYLEFGVYDGTSMITMHRVLEELGYGHIRLFGFDSFEGLPITATTDDEGHWQPGAFKSDYEFTMQVLNSEKVNLQRTFLTKGFFESTLTNELREKHKISKASVMMIDCDMYLSAKEALEFCAPLIVDEAMVVFDDWFPLAERNLGEKRAFNEFLRAHPYFGAEEFGTYPPYGKTFLVSRDTARVATRVQRPLRSPRESVPAP